MKLSTIGLMLFVFMTWSVGQNKTIQNHDFHIVFEETQQGFETGSIAPFAPHFGTQIQLSLKDGDNGYYSSNQAYYLLENYFKTRKVISFEFSSVGETETTPFATGTAVFSTKGMRETVQVYVALQKSDGRWVITEINIY
jgi:hypothetical protein